METPVRAVRIDAETWEALGQAAWATESDKSAVVRLAVAALLGRPKDRNLSAKIRAWRA